MRLLLIILLFGFPVLQLGAQETKPDPSEISRWIERLGAEEFSEREEAEAKLQAFGMDAFAELQQASRSPDLEIAERSKKLLQLIKRSWTDPKDDSYVREQMREYAEAATVQEKVGIVNMLSDWSGMQELADGQGIDALCRIVRFEQEPLVRAEAARSIIAAPPARYSSQKKWFQTVIETFGEPKEEPITRLLVRFAKSHLAAIEYRGKAMFAENPEAPPEELRKEIGVLAGELREFRENREFSEGRRGTDSDILLFYALAELQDAVGLSEELNATLQQALDVVPVLSGEEGISPYWSHFAAALYLSRRNFALWSKNELLMVASKEPRLKSEVYYRAAEQFYLLDDIAQAAQCYGIVLETIADPRNPGASFFSDNPNLIKARHKYFLALLAEEKGELKEAVTLLDEAFVLYPDVSDSLILRYKISQKDEKYRKKTNQLITKAISDLKKRMTDLRDVREFAEPYAKVLNQAAWILANTDGDYDYALQCATKANELDPDNPSIIDTLAHVYFRGREFDKAIETQRLAVQYAPQVQVFRDALRRFEEGKQAKP